MSLIRQRTSVAANSEVNLVLSPFDRFGNRGGQVSVQVTGVAAEAPVGDMLFSLLVGSDIVASRATANGESAVGAGPTNETPAVVGTGLPSDPITVTLINNNAAARVFQTAVNVVNA